MFERFHLSKRFVKIASLAIPALVLAGVLTFVVRPRSAEAHCDSYQGPVATAALHALDANNVDLVLPYVAPEMESELTAAFKQAISVRAMGGDAQQLAEKYFVETAVRLHRVSEGASYTGVTDAPVPEAIVIADRVMEDGKLNEAYKFLDDEMRKGIEENYNKVVEARKNAAKLNTVEANRERVEAELGFEKYIYGLHTAMTAPVGHEGETTAGGHTD